METNNKSREALEAINCIDTRGLKRLLWELVEADIFDGGLINKTIAAVEKARRTLSTPPRNYEVGTIEEQAERFAEYCESEACKRKRCKFRAKALCIERCALEWAQLPYGEKEGVAK